MTEELSHPTTCDTFFRRSCHMCKDVTLHLWRGSLNMWQFCLACTCDTFHPGSGVTCENPYKEMQFLPNICFSSKCQISAAYLCTHVAFTMKHNISHAHHSHDSLHMIKKFTKTRAPKFWLQRTMLSLCFAKIAVSAVGTLLQEHTFDKLHVSSKRLYEKMQIHNGCICLTVLHFVF